MKQARLSLLRAVAAQSFCALPQIAKLSEVGQRAAFDRLPLHDRNPMRKTCDHYFRKAQKNRYDGADLRAIRASRTRWDGQLRREVARRMAQAAA